MLATPKDEIMGTMSFASLTAAVLVGMEQWSTQHLAFIVEMFVKNGGSVVKTQGIFHKHFNSAHHENVSCCNAIQLWVYNLRMNASALKK
jgi:hypothetical protein